MIVIEAFRQTKDRTLRLRDGKRPPVTLAGEHQYHAFVSHIWSTGQDQAAVIKRQLLHLMPAAKVFLDVGHEHWVCRARRSQGHRVGSASVLPGRCA